MAGAEVVVLFGGASTERRVSVASAQHVSELLPEAALWFWAPDGAVHACDRAAVLAHERAFEVAFVPDGEPAWPSLDAAISDPVANGKVFLLALHGGAGEDGRVQEMLENKALAFTGSGAVASRRAFDKLVAKEYARRRSVKTAPATLLPGNDPAALRRQLESFLVTHGRAMVKPVADGSSIGLVPVKSVKDVPRAIEEILAGPRIPRLCEAFVEGRELTIGVVDGPQGPRALPVSEISVAPGGSFDYSGKYLGRGAIETTPARIPAYVTNEAQRLALTMHVTLGCEGYSRTDVISTGRGVVFLETNTLPGLTRASFIPQQLAAEGTSMSAFLEDQLELARRRRDRTRTRAA